ncbi:MAG: arsenic transporter [Bryobacteraceae bacterium]
MTDLIAVPGGYFAVWLISFASIALVLIRPKGLPEALWAVVGAGLLVICRLVPADNALHAIAKGTDVYLFLAGMMIISELARREGVFDWIAIHAVKAARGSERRLFVLVYGVGIAVTIFLSNDATAVVLTPAVQAAVKAAEAEHLPFLFVCAFIANAASFVLPISNPANLVVYGKGLPPLGHWLGTFGMASLASIVVTFLVLRLLSRKLLEGGMTDKLEHLPLTPSGKLTLAGIGFLAIILLVTSAFGKDLGAPTCMAALLVAVAVSSRDRGVPRDIIREVSWSMLPLVAGLFVIVEAINGAGALRAATAALREMHSWRPDHAALSSAFAVALVSNLMNNLPSGLIAGSAVTAAGTTGPLRDAILVGIDLGPNLSATGSLATILWLIAIRREGQKIGFWQFLRWGIVVMPPALVLAVFALLLGWHS